MSKSRLTICLLLAALLGGCGGASNKTAANSAAANAPEVNQPPPAANFDDGNSNVNANANIGNIAPPRRVPRRPKTEELSELLPEDSDFSLDENSLGDIVETRVFKNHELVAKVERTQAGAKAGSSIKVFLKNGKVYALPAGKVRDVLRESPEDIIKALPSDANRSATEAKPPVSTSGSAPFITASPSKPK